MNLRPLQQARRRIGWLLATIVLLSGCDLAGAPQPLPPTPTPVSFMLLADALAAGAPASGAPATVAGYLLADPTGAWLVDGLVFDAAGQARPIEPGAAPVWLGASLPGVGLRAAGSLRYAAVLVRGVFEGPGEYGPEGRYQYQVAMPNVAPLGALETSLGELLAQPSAYDGRLVRLVGGLLVRDTAALLVDRLGAGGLPEQGAVQIKLRGGLHDPQLLAELRGAPSGVVRFGQVQIEGVMRGAVLAPLSISVVR